jgi:hypothetical protein
MNNQNATEIIVSSQNGICAASKLVEWHKEILFVKNGHEYSKLMDLLAIEGLDIDEVFSPDNMDSCEFVDHYLNGLYIYNPVKDNYWAIEWIEGDIVAINPLADYDEESDAWNVYGDIKKSLMDYLEPHQIEAIEESLLPEVGDFIDSGDSEIKALVLIYCSYSLQQARDMMEGFNGIYTDTGSFYQGQIDLIELENEDIRKYISVEKYAQYHQNEFIFLPYENRVAVFVKEWMR